MPFGGYLQRIWDRVVDMVGDTIANFFPVIAKEIKISIAGQDAVKLRAHLDQLNEAADYLKAFCALGREVIADDTLDLVEGSRLAVELETVLDQIEDVVTGVDEDV